MVQQYHKSLPFLKGQQGKRRGERCHGESLVSIDSIDESPSLKLIVCFLKTVMDGGLAYLALFIPQKKTDST